MNCPVLAVSVSLAWLGAAGVEDQRPRSPQIREGKLRIDTSMFDVAAHSGGDFFFWAPGEFSAHAVSGSLIGLEDEEIALRYGELPVSGQLEVSIPVDSGVGRLRVFAGIQKKVTMALTTPDGRVAATSAGMDVLDTAYMLIAGIADPTPGVWKLAVAGEGRFAVTARAPSGTTPRVQAARRAARNENAAA